MHTLGEETHYLELVSKWERGRYWTNTQIISHP